MQHDVVSGEEWLAARQALLAEEKQLAELRARIVERRRALPWTAVDKAYAFDTPTGDILGGVGRPAIVAPAVAVRPRPGAAPESGGVYVAYALPAR